MNAILAEAQAHTNAWTDAEKAPVTETDPVEEIAQEADQGGQGWLGYIRDLLGVARL